MSEPTLYFFLFQKEFLDGSPLFGNANDLTRVICAEPGSTYFRRENSVSSMLSLCLRGKRRFPRALKMAIESAAVMRIPNIGLENQIAFIEELRKSFDRPPVDSMEYLEVNSPLAQVMVGASKSFKEIVSIAQSASTHFVVLSEFNALFHSPHQKVTFFVDLLVRRCSLFGDEYSPSIAAPRYEFYFPSQNLAGYFWEELLLKITRSNPVANLPIEAAKRALNSLSENGVIKIWVVDEPALCSLPLIVFDHESPNPQGYSLYFDADGRPHSLKWSVEHMFRFRNCFYKEANTIKARLWPFANMIHTGAFAEAAAD